MSEAEARLRAVTETVRAFGMSAAEAADALRPLGDVARELERRWGRCSLCGYLICRHHEAARVWPVERGVV